MVVWCTIEALLLAKSPMNLADVLFGSEGIDDQIILYVPPLPGGIRARFQCVSHQRRRQFAVPFSAFSYEYSTRSDSLTEGTGNRGAHRGEGTLEDGAERVVTAQYGIAHVI